MWIVIIYIIIYVVGVILFTCGIIKAIHNHYQNEIEKLNIEIENINIELESVLSYEPYQPYRPYNINKHLDYEYPNHTYHLLV
jgi:hypothetical protein